jgi:anti-sigma factor RsiW
MRCGAARKRLSDDLDGALAPGRRERLEAHLSSCAACRACRDALARLQAAARPGADRAPEYWAGFERRLASRLDGAGTAPAPFSGRRRLAWTAAGALALAVAGVIWYLIPRQETSVTTAWLAAGDPLLPLIEEAEADPDLAWDIERAIRASIKEMTPVPNADAAALLVADPLFWEGLSEDELRYIAAELENETGRGGPQ